MVTLSTQHDLALTHHHPLQPWLRIIAARPLVENRDAKSTATIAVRTAQTKLQIEDEHIRRQPMPPLQKSPRILDTSPTRTPHDDHLMRRRVAKPQPPIAIFRQDLTQGSDGVSVSV